jgi:ferrochelatase
MILANFGGPRNLEEIAPFLEELLCDRDVVRTALPNFLHNWLFKKIARKRAGRIGHDYSLIGGKSPIYFDTESLSQTLSQQLRCPVIPFHRYLPATHQEFIEKVESLSSPHLLVLPMFPQFTYATTGSIARFFQTRLPKKTTDKLCWLPSYCDHPVFILHWQQQIQTFLDTHQIQNPFLLFSAHGIPKVFLKDQDPYQQECERSFQAVMQAFPNTPGLLAYQSKFGPGEWLRPYTSEVSEQILTENPEKRPVVVIPISFTSDHIETLFEIESQYLPAIRANGLTAYRCPVPDWSPVIARVLDNAALCSTQSLIRK